VESTPWSSSVSAGNVGDIGNVAGIGSVADIGIMAGTVADTVVGGW